MESADTGGDEYGERVATELVRLREALDEIRRRPVPLDAETLRHVISASLSEASAPPPNLLVTAIRRLDRVDARLEAIESAVSNQAALPPAGGAPRGRGAPAAAPAAPSRPAPAGVPLPPGRPIGLPPVDAEAIADVVARRLGPLISSAPPGRSSGGPTVEDLVAALRPLVPGAARSVLRRGGREPSAQAVDVLQQAAIAALDEAASSLGPIPAQATPTPSPWAARPLPPPAPVALPPPPPSPPPAPPPPPLDVEALASTIASRVTASVTESVARQLTEPEPPAPPPTPASPPEARQPAPAVDAAAVADLVAARLAEQPPPQAVVPAVAMVPLVAAVGNVEAAVARLTGPDEDVVGAVARLEAGVDALAQALEEDRAALADEVRRAFEEVTELVRHQPPAAATSADPAAAASAAEPGEGGPDRARRRGPEGGRDPVLAAVLELRERLDHLTRDVGPLAEVDLAAAVPAIERRGQRLERSIGHILTALAAVAEHLSEQSSLWRAGVDGRAAVSTDAALAPAAPAEPAVPEVVLPADWPGDVGGAVLTLDPAEVAQDVGTASPSGSVTDEGAGDGSQADPGLAAVASAAGPVADGDDPGEGSQAEPGPVAVVASPGADRRADDAGVDPVEAVAGSRAAADGDEGDDEVEGPAGRAAEGDDGGAADTELVLIEGRARRRRRPRSKRRFKTR